MAMAETKSWEETEEARRVVHIHSVYIILFGVP